MFPEVRVILLSAHIRDGLVAGAYRCGAWGYFAKSDEPGEIEAGILEVASSTAGTFVMGAKVRAHCRPTPGGPAGPAARPLTPFDCLTQRELEIVRLIGKGLSRTQIARELCRSAKTIDGHQDRALRKLGLSCRAELMRMAIREGLSEA
jgi:two-component system invasion response regulator UvrY